MAQASQILPLPLTRRCRARRGYSLIEVLMTSLIIQIIAGMVAVSVSNVTESERTSFAGQEAVSALRYARQLAQTTGVPCGVIFDNTNQQIKVFRGTTTNIVSDNAMPGGQYIVNMGNQANTRGVKIAQISLAGGSTTTVTYGYVGGTSGVAKGLGSTNNTGFIKFSLGGASKTVNIPSAGDPTLN